MLFPTAEFAVFFLVVFPLGWALIERPRAWKLSMLAASYIFYGFWDPRFVLLIALSTVVNAGLGRSIAHLAAPRRSWVLGLAVVFNLAVLGAFKYYGFFATSLNGLLREMGVIERLPLIDLILPVGISFFTFQALSYVIDVYRGKLAPVALLDFAVFLSFFPHVVAGPIVRAAEFVPQLYRARGLTDQDIGRAFWLFAGGLFKKVVISSYVAAAIVDPVFAAPGAHSAPEVLAAIYGYTLQIYADFSGYTDMAIAVALLCGIRFPENFNRPYAATSIGEFWRRWHMTLSRWLRDYVYIPLGGNRKGTGRTYANLLATMTLGGLWHGAAGTFVAWGVYHGLLLVGERMVGDLRARATVRPVEGPGHELGAPGARAQAGGALVQEVGAGVPAAASALATDRQPAAARALATDRQPAPTPVGWIGRAAAWCVTFNLVAIGWVLFRSESFTAAVEMLRQAVTDWGPAPLLTPGLVVVIAGGLMMQLVPRGVGDRLQAAFVRLPIPVQGLAFGASLAVAVMLGPQGVAPFIYFQF